MTFQAFLSHTYIAKLLHHTVDHKVILNVWDTSLYYISQKISTHIHTQTPLAPTKRERKTNEHLQIGFSVEEKEYNTSLLV